MTNTMMKITNGQFSFNGYNSNTWNNIGWSIYIFTSQIKFSIANNLYIGITVYFSWIKFLFSGFTNMVFGTSTNLLWLYQHNSDKQKTN